jgi:hypothetical protein
LICALSVERSHTPPLFLFYTSIVASTASRFSFSNHPQFHTHHTMRSRCNVHLAHLRSSHTSTSHLRHTQRYDKTPLARPSWRHQVSLPLSADRPMPVNLSFPTETSTPNVLISIVNAVIRQLRSNSELLTTHWKWRAAHTFLVCSLLYLLVAREMGFVEPTGWERCACMCGRNRVPGVVCCKL